MVTSAAGSGDAASAAGSGEAVVRRRQAAAVAGHTGDRETARRLLSDPAPAVRATSLGALARLGEVTADEVTAALADPSAIVRRRACEVAVGVAAVDLRPALGDADAGVVEVAAWAIGERTKLGTPALEDLQQVVANHEDPLCREAAVAALGAIGDARALPAILAALGDKANVRRRAVIALAPFSGPEVDAALEKAREDRDWQVRQAAEDMQGR